MATLVTSQWFGLVAVLLTALHAYRRRSLDTGGILAALFVGTIHALHRARPLVLLLTFFLAGTRLTKAGQVIKRERLTSTHTTSSKKTSTGTDADEKVPPRTAIQVFANAGIATVFILLHFYMCPTAKELSQLSLSVARDPASLLLWGILAQYAAAAGDTFSSELGVLNEDWPLSITTFRKVPPGTNGGVSVLGTIAAVLGGLVIGIAAALAMPCDGFWTRLTAVSLCTTCGLVGSLVDSVLGATMQRTVYDVDRRMVIEVHGGGRHAQEYIDSLRQQQRSKTSTGGEENKIIVMGADVLDNNQVNLLASVITVVFGMVAVWTTAVVTGR